MLRKSIGILCPGPSLAGFLRRPVRHDLYIGVNRGVVPYACDWWVVGDAVAFLAIVERCERDDPTNPITTMARPRIFTSARAFEEIRDQNEGFSPRSGFEPPVAARSGLEPPVAARSGFGWLLYENLETTCLAETGWRDLSLTAAMVLSEHLQATEIVIYGCDWQGDDDFDGDPITRAGRSDTRWNAERHKYGHIEAWLNRCGIAVRRAGVPNKQGFKSAEQAVQTLCASED